MESSFSGLLSKVAAHAELRDYLKDEAFKKTVEDIERNPAAIAKYIGDPRIIKVLNLTVTKQANSKPAAEEFAKMDTGSDERTDLDAEGYKEKGNAAYKKRDFATAIECYHKAFEMEPKHLAYLTNRAAAKLEMNDIDGAIADCEQVIKTNKEENLHCDFKIIARAYARIGSAYLKKDDLDNGIEYFEKSLLEAHDDKIYKKLQETKKLKKKRQEDAYIDPSKSQAERMAGNELFKKGNFPDALLRYSEAIKRNPTDPAPYSNRAAAYMKLGEFPMALKDCEKCLELDPKYVKAYSRKGAIHYFMKEYHKSLDAYKKALEIDPSNTDLRAELNRTVAVIQQSASANEVDEEQVHKAMADPEIQRILQDPSVNQALKELSENPQLGQRVFDDPVMSDKINKLIAAGLVRLASR
eukprot:Plantae.Rhodophyta-Purpureofilum_apyrenoidigerum.ctg19024.p1 GENE.Plantae.Rhodophyta-Purpureofilum_apyrenoidigerum.ctg19024~~Plantae.Rhodophyta-Purpureofilum_apyrenoidigerum.ctg19024.p1  ORF type:complete len:454 (-),score=121.65 Plantae.Rhodophyta-Purpureofilum_apyrenoidigerum.ctg19024:43-1278(-)